MMISMEARCLNARRRNTTVSQRSLIDYFLCPIPKFKNGSCGTESRRLKIRASAGRNRRGLSAFVFGHASTETLNGVGSVECSDQVLIHHAAPDDAAHRF